MLIPSKYTGHSLDGMRRAHFTGGGGGGGSTTNTTNTTNIPEYARPYVENMLGATQQQLFNTQQVQGTDVNGDPVTNTQITGVKPYQAFGQNGAGIGQGEMQAAQAAVAGPTALQNQAYQGAANMQVPGQFGMASGLAGLGALGSLNAGNQYNQMATNPYAMQDFMSPYMQNVVNSQMQEANRNYDISGTQQASKATQSGAFGGSRGAIMAAENERNRNTALNGIQAQGLQSAFQNAQQAQQFGASLGMQGYGQALQGAGQLAGIGAQDLAAQQGILNQQNQFGAQQQSQNQNVINQALQNYSNTQQYPMQQLSFMNSMLRGVPLSNTNVTQYQAAPSAVSQLAGLGTAAYGASKLMGAKKGGAIKAPDNRNKQPGGLMDLALDKMGA